MGLSAKALQNNRTDIVPVLRLNDGTAAAKTFTRLSDGTLNVSKYDSGTWFTPEAVQVSGLSDLVALLGRLENEKAVVVRGMIQKEPQQDGIRRTLGGEGFLAPTSRRWVMLDVDGLPLPDGLSMTGDVEAVVDHVVGRLGSPWSDSADCVWQASSSAGIEPGARLHLWFWFDELVSPDLLKQAIRATAKKLGADADRLDHRMWVANQVHYVAAPTFVGMADPISQRLGMLLKGGDVKVADLPVQKTNPLPRAVSGVSRSTFGGAGAVQGNVITLKTVSEVAFAVRMDIEKLAQHRWGGAVPDGHRNDIMLAYGIACAIQSPERAWNFMIDGASRLVPGKSGPWLRSKLSAVLSRIERHLTGERVEFDGREFSPIYTPKTAWFIDLLQISRDEMEQADLRVLVDRAVEARMRRAEAKKNGVRAQKAAATSEAVRKALEQLGHDAGDAAVAELAGCSVATVNRHRNRGVEKGDNICTIPNTTVTSSFRKGFHEGIKAVTDNVNTEIGNDRDGAKTHPAKEARSFGASNTSSRTWNSAKVIPFPSPSVSSEMEYRLRYESEKWGYTASELASEHSLPISLVMSVLQSNTHTATANSSARTASRR